MRAKTYVCGAAAVIGEVEWPANDCAAPFLGLFASCDITGDEARGGHSFGSGFEWVGVMSKRFVR